MKKMYVFFICLTFLMLSINAAGKSEGNYKKIVLDSSSNGMTVDLPEDAMIILKLETHPSSGYQWQLINHSKSKSVVKELKWSKHGAKHPEFEEQERIIPGAPQTQLLRLVGEKKR
jgi:predicted secreted protein